MGESATKKKVADFIIWMIKWFPIRLKICKDTHYICMSMLVNFQPFWKPFGHLKQGKLSDARLYLSEKYFLVLDDQMVSKTAENLQAYSYMYNEYPYKFSAVLKIILSSK